MHRHQFSHIYWMKVNFCFKYQVSTSFLIPKLDYYTVCCKKWCHIWTSWAAAAAAPTFAGYAEERRQVITTIDTNHIKDTNEIFEILNECERDDWFHAKTISISTSDFLKSHTYIYIYTGMWPLQPFFSCNIHGAQRATFLQHLHVGACTSSGGRGVHK